MIKLIVKICVLIGIILFSACSDSVAQPVQPLGTIVNKPWLKHTIYSGLLGADGVDVRDVDDDGLQDVVSPWEQSGRVTATLGSGVTVELGLGLSLGAVEDAAFADIDGDGFVDIVSASEGKSVRVHFAPTNSLWPDRTAWVTVPIAVTVGVCRWMRVVPTDIDNDGDIDIIAGGKSTPAFVMWLEQTGNPRIGSSWIRHDLSPVGWTMALEVTDMDSDGDKDVYLSDRQYQTTVPRNYSLMGDRWLEQTNDGSNWINHSVGTVIGEHRMGSLVDWDNDGDLDVVSCRSSAGSSILLVKLRTGDDVTELSIPAPANTGVCQHVVTGDLDGDGYLDLVISHSEAVGDLSGLVWLRGPSWDRYEIAGPIGTKYDNIKLVDMDNDEDLDVVTSEQTDQLGAIWYENPRVRTPPPPPDASLPTCNCCALCQ